MATGSSRDSEAQPRTLTVWVDAQLPPALARWLHEEHGVDAAHVQDLDLTVARDRDIFEAAAHADAVVITKDSDFVTMLQQRGPPPQIVWLRSGNTTNREFRRIVLELWPNAAKLLQADEPLVEIRRRTDPPA